jgi:hypothetical protein
VAITIERQLPERGARDAAAAPAGQCCCCCCCCLHSVGGVIGALSARAKPVDQTIPVSAIEGRTLEPRHSASSLYWAIIAIMASVASAYFVTFEHHQVESAEIALMLAICFPGVQLAASVVAAIVIMRSKRVGKEVRLRHLGKITLRAFLGAVIGVLIMLPMLGRC